MQPYEFYNEYPDFFTSMYAPPVIALIILLVLLELVLKGVALWRAARMNMQIWFTVLLIVNSAGLLPLIFLLLTNHEYDRFLHGPKPAQKKTR